MWRTKSLVLLAVAGQFMTSSGAAQETARYQVVINHEGQYSIWVTGEDVPRGWKPTGRTGSLDQMADYIEEVWTDMRPLSVRRRMSEQRLDREESVYVVLRREEDETTSGGGIPSGYYGYLLWPADDPVPEELTPTGKKGTFREATTYIEEVWTDMRPLSVRSRFKRR